MSWRSYPSAPFFFSNIRKRKKKDKHLRRLGIQCFSHLHFILQHTVPKISFRKLGSCGPDCTLSQPKINFDFSFEKAKLLGWPQGTQSIAVPRRCGFPTTMLALPWLSDGLVPNRFFVKKNPNETLTVFSLLGCYLPYKFTYIFMVRCSEWPNVPLLNQQQHHYTSCMTRISVVECD